MSGSVAAQPKAAAPLNNAGLTDVLRGYGNYAGTAALVEPTSWGINTNGIVMLSATNGAQTFDASSLM